MTQPPDNLTRGEHVRSFASLAGTAAALVGAVAWPLGWEHGHSLITLGLLSIYLFEHDWRIYLRRGWAVGHVMLARRSIAKSELEEAEKHSAKAVRIFRRIAAHRPERTWELAATLDQQRRLLDELGRHEDALTVARETANACRAAVTYDARRTPQLAEALNAIAVVLGRLDREAEAIPYTEEAIALDRQLVAEYEGLLAVNLSNVVISLAVGQEWERALPAAEEAWKLRRRLALTDPTLRDEAVADADQLRRVLHRLDRPDDVLRVSESLVDHERALLAADPARLPAYAEAVRKLGTSLVDVNRVPEAKARWYEALELLRRFSEDNPDGRSSYAMTCEQVGYALGMLRADDESLAAIRTGLAIRRTLAAEDGQRHQELVRALTGAAVNLAHAEQPQLAKQFATEGLALFHERPEASGPPQILQVLQEHAEESAG